VTRPEGNQTEPESRATDGWPRRFVVVSGLVASGKSTLSRALAERLGASRLEADRIRGTLLRAIEQDEAGAEARWRRDLSPEFETDIYRDLLRRADESLQRRESLVIDGCFPRRWQREAARALAARHGLTALFVACRVPESTLRDRLAERDRVAGRPVWATIQANLAKRYEPPDELSTADRMEVCTDGPVEPLVEEILLRLESHRPTAAPSIAPASPSIRPRVVSFDCWSTLLFEEDWPWAHGLRVDALRDAASRAGREVSREAAASAFEKAWVRHMALWRDGRVSGAAEVARWGFAELEIDDAHPVLARLIHRFEEASHTSHVVALDGAKALLARLEDAGIPCVLVCDTGLTPGRVVRKLLDRVGLLEHLRAVAFSDEVGAPKPDARAFRAALDAVGVAPEHGVHVGDLRRTDVAGARALGMQTVRIRAHNDDLSEAPEADFVVDSHRELARLLGFDLSRDA
jgi:FMN phosphatase YigB (HAD superfamily)/predicted kinase